MLNDTRPLSPSLQIYRPQLTSVLSISHRLTGVLLSAGAIFLVVWLTAAAAGSRSYAALDEFLGSWLGLALLLAWAFSLFFHLCNGVRHLLWDAGYGFELRTIYASGWAVLAVSALLTLAAWIAGLRFAG
ncbi:MAG TPA: succinate dehydrogenase, cytochrome b556 subunit [Steroidobacteraceae bacterium]|nr:succinate dehydrogenase, cytochrome b556 subunit [Steroidobacteraceae bacterium]